MTEQEAIGGNQPPEDKPGASANPSEPLISDDFTPEQQKKLGKILSAERDKVKSQFADYDSLKAKLKEIEKSKLTEAQQLQLERDEAKKETESTKKKLEKFEALELRTKLFSDYKTKSGEPLPSNLLKYVKGKNEEEILKNIESIAADFGLKLEKRKNIGNPTPAGGDAVPDKHGFMNDMIKSAAGLGGR
jgi:hypothetical protein